MISQFCNAQNTNLEFGNPTIEEMNMTSCSVEPNAPAVVLCALNNSNCFSIDLLFSKE